MSDAGTPSVRRATRDDLPANVRLLADGALGATRETVSDPLPASYGAAFDEIDRDPNQAPVVFALPGRPVAGCG